MDAFKKYVKDHESDLQPETPDADAMWKRMQQKKSPGVYYILAIAAAACIALIVILSIKKTAAPGKSLETVKTESPSVNYEQLVSYQLDQIRSTPIYAESPGYFSGFKEQLEQMDSDDAQLKKDIAQYGMNAAMLDQIINVYQQKLNLLKGLQKEIQKMNSQSGENKKGYYLNL